MRCWTCFSVSCHCSTPNFRRGPTILVGPPSLSKNYCFPILCRVSEAGVGADAYIGPPGSCEFAADYRKKRCNLPGRCRHRPLHRNGQCMRMCRCKSPLYISPVPSVWKNELDRCAENHTIGAVPLLSFHCEAVLQKEPAANCTFSAYSALQNWAYQFVGENPSRKPPLAASRAVMGAFCLLKKGGVGFPAGDGEAQTACLKEKGLKRFQCHRAI